MKTAIPKAAAARLKSLAESIQDGNALVAASMARSELLRQELAEVMHRAYLGPQQADECKPRIAEMEAELDGLISQMQGRKERVQNDQKLAAKLQEYLAALPPGVTLIPAPLPASEATLDEALTGIEAARKEIDRLKAMRRAKKQKVFPRETLMKLARDLVKRQASYAAPIIRGLHGEQPLSISFAPDGRNALTLLAWLDPEKLVARIAEHFPPEQDEAVDLAAIASLDAAILQAERAEQQLIARANELGQQVLIRPRSDPRAVLGVVEAKATKKKAA